MQRTRTYRTIALILLVLILAWSAWQVAAHVLPRQDWLLRRVERSLASGLGEPYGLELRYGRLEAGPGLGFTLHDVRVRDQRESGAPTVLRLDRARIRLGIYRLLRGLRHPESAIVEITLDGPRLTLIRGRDGWLWRRFADAPEQKDRFRFLVRVRAARLDMRPSPLPGISLARAYLPEASLDLRAYPRVRGEGAILFDLDPHLRLHVKADYDLGRGNGWADLSWREASLARWQGLDLLKSERFQVHGGRMRGVARLILDAERGVRLQRGAARLDGGIVSLDGIRLPRLSVDGRAVLSARTLTVTHLRVRAGRDACGGDLTFRFERAGPRVDGDITVTRLELAGMARFLPLPPGTALRGVLGGRVHLTGPLARPLVRGSMTMADAALSWPGMPPLQRVSARGDLDGKVLHLKSFQATAGGGRISGRGTLRFLPSPSLEMDWRAARAPAGRILACLGQSGWDGEFDAEGRLEAARGGWDLSASLAWRQLSRQGGELPEGRGKIDCRSMDGETGFTAAGRLGAGGFTALGRWSKGGWQARGTLQKMPLTLLTAFTPAGTGAPSGEATGGFTYRGGEGSPDLRFDGRVDRLGLGGYSIDACEGTMSYRGSALFIEEARIILGEARASVRANLDWAKRTVALAADVQCLPLALLAPDASGRLEGRFELDGRWPGNLRGRGEVRARALSWRGVSLGTGGFSLSLDGGRLYVERGHLEDPAGRLDLTGAVGLSGRRELAMTITRLDWDISVLAPFLPRASRPRGRIVGVGHLTGSLDAPAIAARVTAGPGQIYGVDWRALVADLRWQDRLGLVVEGGRLNLAGARFAIAGSLGASGWNLGVETEGVDLAALAGAVPVGTAWPYDLGGLAALKAKIAGPLDRPTVRGELTASQLHLGGLACTRLSGRFVLDGGGLDFSAVEASAGERRYEASGRLDLTRGTMALDLEMRRGELAGLLSLAAFDLPWPVQGDVTGRAKISGTLRRPELEAAFTLERGRIGGTAVEGEAKFAYDGRLFALERLILTHDGGILSAAGRLAGRDFAVQISGRNLPLAAMSELAGWEGQLEGRSDVMLTLARTGPELQGRFSLAIQSGGSWERIPLDGALIEGSIAGREIVLAHARVQSAGHTLLVQGRMPFPAEPGMLAPILRGVPPGRGGLDMRMEGEDVPLPLLNPFLGGWGEFTGGRLNLAVKVGGTWAKPALAGVASLSGGSGRLNLLPDRFKELEAEVRLDSQRFSVSSARARIGAGAVRLGGEVVLGAGGPEYDLRFQGHGISYRNEFFDGVASELDLFATGGPVPLVAGTITLGEGRIGANAPAVGTRPPPLKLDVHLFAGKNVRFYMPAVADIPAIGDVRVRGTLVSPTLAGVVTASRGGVIYVYGERFSLSSGAATFTPERGYLPYVELEGSKARRGVKLFVRVRGEVNEAGLAIDLWSDPPLPQRDILAMLGWPGPLTGGEPIPGLFVSGLELFMDTVFGRISEDFRRLLDADRLQLGIEEGSGSLSLQMGKYILDDLYVSYQISFGEFSTRTWSFDYYLQPSLVLSAVFSSVEAPSYNLSYQFRF